MGQGESLTRTSHTSAGALGSSIDAVIRQCVDALIQ